MSKQEIIRNDFTTNEGGDKVKKFLDDEKILASLIAGGSVRKAAQISGVSVSTIRNRLADPVFKEKYDVEKGAILEHAIDAMKANLSVAVDVLTATMEDEEAARSVRVQAADVLMRHCCRYISALDFDRRLTALEQAQLEEEDVEG